MEDRQVLDMDRVRSGIFLVLSLILLLGNNLPSVARADAGYLREVRTLETSDLGLAHPAGLAFSPDANTFAVVEADSTIQSKLVTFTPYEGRVDSVSLDNPLYDPINVTFDSRFGRLLLLENPSQLTAMSMNTAGQPEPFGAAATQISINRLGLQDPGGLAVDPASGDLFVLDRSARRIVRVTPDSQAGLAGTATSNPQAISWIGLEPSGLKDPRGLALNPSNGHLYILSPGEQKLYELDQAGQVVTALDLTPFHFVQPQGLVFAPSGDPTDSPSNINLYVADAGPALGRIVELSFIPAPAPLAGVPTVAATLERTTLTSQFSPPSPDPAGIAYLAHSNTLMISDSEVDEMPPYFTGANVFETTLSGGLARTWGTTAFSSEPTGVAYDPVSRHVWLSDDDAKRVHELNPGADRLYGTSDDTRTYFSTSTFGSQDPEGITFDTSQRHLFVVDGLGTEVYDISPGINGVFDGITPPGDDVVTHFDVSALGIVDPEGVEFDPNNHHLYIMGNGIADLVAETSTTGFLFRYISLSSFDAIAPAGIAYAPSSTDPAQRHLYIVDRVIDNNADPNENDGKLYEVSFPPLTPAANQPPVVNAGPEQTIAFPAGASLDGTVADDGLPVPPEAVTTTWSKVSGPGTVTFGNASAVDTTGSFSAEGTYVLRLTAYDGALSTADDIIITVSPQANKAPAVSAGPNQTITLPANASLNGTVTDDGLPNPPGAVTTIWSKVSGPGSVSFANASAVDTTASFSIAGTYRLRLTANDGGLSSNDRVTITVLAPNQAPVVNAGIDQAITFPANAILHGTVTDDGLPSPPTLTTTWSTASGPGTVTFANASAVDTTASFSVEGSYVLRLTANDGALSSSDQLTVVVLRGGVHAFVYVPLVMWTGP